MFILVLTDSVQSTHLFLTGTDQAAEEEEHALATSRHIGNPAQTACIVIDEEHSLTTSRHVGCCYTS